MARRASSSAQLPLQKAASYLRLQAAMGATANPIQEVTAELQKRSVFHVAAVYCAVAFVLLQACDLIFPALMLPAWSFRFLVWVAIAGFPIALGLAWFFDITSQGVVWTHRRKQMTDALLNASALRRRVQILSLVVIGVMLTAAGGLGAVRSRLGQPRTDDGRIGVAVFPFRAVGMEGGEWSEGIADLLTTALDGTAGLRVVDPWALWQDLRDPPNALASSPDPTEASALGREAGARRIVLGSAVAAGNEVRLSIRIYDPRFARPLDTFALTGERSNMTGLVERLAVQVITRAWDDTALPGLARLEPNATRSPDALKAYLDAKMAMRRGLPDSAATAIDRAIALDSTFALALVDAVGIHSWYQFSTGRPFSGFFPLLERARRHADSLSERSRLRLDATLASVRTQGKAASDALQSIIAIDSTDLAAWSFLAYVRQVYGWQFGASLEQAIQASDRVVSLDPNYVPGLVARAWLRSDESDSTSARLLADRLLRVGENAPMARNTARALLAVTGNESSFATLLQELVGAPPGEWIVPYRWLRALHPARAEVLLAALRANAGSVASPSPAGEDARLRVAEGRPVSADSLVQALQSTDQAAYWQAQRVLAASALAGSQDPGVARRAVDALARHVPADSMMAYHNTRPAWWNGWLVGAYHAQFGDTTIAHQYHRAFSLLPAGGSPSTYREALQADIASRLAERRGDVTGALSQARSAYDFWYIHTENQLESMPEPAIRFQLARLLKMTGDRAGAEAFYRSLIPPTTWMGFYTAHAALEVADLEAARGDTDSASRHYAIALRLWERGGREAEALRAQVESRISALLNRRRG
jgi:tetratricopeptide (TPR) repeat protein